MRTKVLRKLMVLAALGGVAFQSTNCIQASTTVTAIATVVTAGGVIYIVRRIID